MHVKQRFSWAAKLRSAESVAAYLRTIDTEIGSILWQTTSMGFADLSIAEIASDHDTSVEEVMSLCDRMGIAYKNPHTRLALEDAKAIISAIMAQFDRYGTDLQEDRPAGT